MLDTQLQTYLSGISEWRQTKDDELRSDDGWLTLVGLLWLNEGINSIGSDSCSRSQSAVTIHRSFLHGERAMRVRYNLRLFECPCATRV